MDVFLNNEEYNRESYGYRLIYGINNTFIGNSGSGNVLGDPPSGFSVSGQYYDISTTAEYSGTLHFLIPYDEDTVGDENLLVLMHYNEIIGEWEEVPPCSEHGISVDIINNVVHGEVASLSMFALFSDVGPPSITLLSPEKEGALQDGILFSVDAYDFSGGMSVNITIQELYGESSEFHSLR